MRLRESCRATTVFDSPLDDAGASTLAKVYKVTIASAALTLALSFIIYGSFLLRVLAEVCRTRGREKKD